MSVHRRESKRLREAGLAMHLETGCAGGDVDCGRDAPLAKRRRSTRLGDLQLPASAGIAVSALEQQGVPHYWDQLSFELGCRVLSCLSAVDVARMALTSRRWNNAVSLNLNVRTALSFSDGPRGIVPPGLSNAVLHSLLGRCPRLQHIYGLHFSSPLTQGTTRCAVPRKHYSRLSSGVSDGGAREPLTVVGIIRALRQCKELEGVEISDLMLLEFVTEVFPEVRILHCFRNRHGRLPLEAAILGEPSNTRLCPDVLTTSIELYAVTLPTLPRLRHVRRLRLQYVQFSHSMPFDNCGLPLVESFVMKFCTVLPERDHNAFFIDLHPFQLDLPCYRPLLESLAAAPNLSSLELVALPISGGSLQQMVMNRRAAAAAAGGGCFTKLRHVALGNCPNVVEDDLGVLIVSSSMHLERLSVQQSLSRDSLLRALTVCGCVLPSLEHLRLGYSEQPPANLDLVEPRDRHRMTYDFDRYRTRSPCLLTDGGLTLVLASALMPALRSLAIADSPHLIDSRTWTAPIRTKLTDLTLTRCHSLRLSDLEDAIEQMTALQTLTLEHVFREPPKGCWHVGLTAGTGLGASAGPFGMAVGRTSARTSAARHHNSPASTSAVGRAGGDGGAGGSAAATSSSPADTRAAAATGGRQCTCAAERPLASSMPYRASQVHAYTQVSNDELRGGSSARSSSSCGRIIGSISRSSDENGAAAGIPGAAAADAQPSTSTSPSASADQRLRQQAVHPGSDASGCGLCPSCGGVRQAPPRHPNGPCSRHRQHRRHGWGTRRSARRTSAAGDAAHCPDCQPRQDVADSGATSESGRSSRAAAAAAPAAAAAATSDSPASCRPLASKATGTSDPLPQPYSENPFCLRSTSLVSLNLEDVGISSLVFESCPKLDTVTAFGCRSLRHVAVGDKQLIGPLSRLTLNCCPRLDAAQVAHLMLCQPVPPPPTTEGAIAGRLRVCSMEANWKGGKALMTSSFVDFVKYWQSCSHVTDRADVAYVVAEEAGPWTDVRRRVQLESSLGSLLTPSVDAERSDRMPNSGGTAAGSSAAGSASGRRQVAGLRLHRGRAEVAVARPQGVTDEDELSRDGLVEKPLRVRYAHSICQPCASCHRTIDPWIAHDCAARWRKACECLRASTSVPLHHITCVYFYATAVNDVDSL